MSYNLSEIIWTEPPEWPLVAGATEIFDVLFEEASNITAADADAYEEGAESDAEATLFPSGAITINGNIVRYKPLTGLTADKSYIVIWKATWGGRTSYRKTRIIAVRPAAGP